MGSIETFDPLDPEFLDSIAEDKEIEYFSSTSEDDDEDAVKPKKRKKKTAKEAQGKGAEDFQDGFTFDVEDSAFALALKVVLLLPPPFVPCLLPPRTIVIIPPSLHHFPFFVLIVA